MTFFIYRRHSTSSTCSASSDESPSAAAALHHADYSQYQHHQQHRCDNTTRPRMSLNADAPPSRRQSAASDRSCEGMTAGDCKELWRCMLELQEAYNCYHSTRIDLALDAGDAAVNLMPNRFIIDTLNESVIDLLPEEGWSKLDRCLRQGSKTCREIH